MCELGLEHCLGPWGYPFVWFRYLPRVVWERHLHERKANKGIANNAIDNYLWHPPGFKAVDPGLFEWWEQIYTDSLVFIMGMLSATDFAPFWVLHCFSSTKFSISRLPKIDRFSDGLDHARSMLEHGPNFLLEHDHVHHWTGSKQYEWA